MNGPTFRLLDGTKRDMFTPGPRIADIQQHDPDGDERDRQDRADRAAEKASLPWEGRR